MEVIAKSVCGSSITDHKVLIAPFFSKDFSEKMIVSNSGDAVISRTKTLDISPESRWT